LFLHHERLLFGGEGDQDPLYLSRRAAVSDSQRSYEPDAGERDGVRAIGLHKGVKKMKHPE